MNFPITKNVWLTIYQSLYKQLTWSIYVHFTYTLSIDKRHDSTKSGYAMPVFVSDINKFAMEISGNLMSILHIQDILLQYLKFN